MMRGAILWRGPSAFDGAPIFAAITGLDARSKNAKTGAMAQTWILREDAAPHETASDGRDSAICGNCALRGGSGRDRTCYVNLFWAPLGVWKAAGKGRYGSPVAAEDLPALGAGRIVRLGAYGDPAAVPAGVWRRLLAKAKGWTGYTHSWRLPRVAELRDYCMASVDSPAEAVLATRLGWRTFRVRRPGEALIPSPREVVCPASAEAGHRTTCAACRLCDGGARAKAPNVAIRAHGGKAAAFDRARTQAPLFAPRGAVGLDAAPFDALQLLAEGA